MLTDWVVKEHKNINNFVMKTYKRELTIENHGKYEFTFKKVEVANGSNKFVSDNALDKQLMHSLAKIT